MVTQSEREIESLVAQAEREQESLDRRREPMGVLGVLVAGASLVVCLTYALGTYSNGPLRFLMVTGFLVCLAVPAVLVYRRRAISREHRALIDALMATEDVRVVPALCRYLASDPGTAVRRLVVTLTQLLPCMPADALDTGALQALVRSATSDLLYRQDGLGDSEVADFQVAALGAVGRAGNPRALAAIRDIAERQPRTPLEAEVVEAARTCVAHLSTLVTRTES